jgi:hypothetical protein
MLPKVDTAAAQAIANGQASIAAAIPPAPNAAMLGATTQNFAQAQAAQLTAASPAAPVMQAAPAVQARAPEVPVFQETTVAEELEALEKAAPTASNFTAMSAGPSVPASEGLATMGGDLARARAIAQRLGITNLTDDEYDIPTYMRRQQKDQEI